MSGGRARAPAARRRAASAPACPRARQDVASWRDPGRSRRRRVEDRAIPGAGGDDLLQSIVLNGGIRSLDEAEEHLAKVNGVMLGRAAYQTPYLLAEVDRRFFGSQARPATRREVIERLIPYIERHLARGGRLNNVTRHILGLYHGEPGGRLFRRQLSGLHERADVEPLLEALAVVDRAASQRRAAA